MSTVTMQFYNTGSNEPSELPGRFRSLYGIVGGYDNQHLSLYSLGCLFETAAERSCHIVCHLRSHLALQILRSEILAVVGHDGLQEAGKLLGRRLPHAILCGVRDKAH